MGQPAQPPNPGKPKRGAPQDTSLAGLLIPKLAGRMQLLLMRSEAVCFWLRGSIQLGTHSTWWKSDRANEEREFAARFIPFKQMVGLRSAVGTMCSLVWCHVSNMQLTTQTLSSQASILWGPRWICTSLGPALNLLHGAGASGYGTSACMKPAQTVSLVPLALQANATGLWGGVPVIGQRVIGLLCGLLPHRFWDTLDSPNYHANAVLAHSELLTGLLASDYGLVSAPQVAGGYVGSVCGRATALTIVFP
jgi:hypothetical protein